MSDAQERLVSVKFCQQCGAAFSDPKVRFCTNCGAERKSVPVESHRQEAHAGAASTDSASGPSRVLSTPVAAVAEPQASVEAGVTAPVAGVTTTLEPQPVADAAAKEAVAAPPEVQPAASLSPSADGRSRLSPAAVLAGPIFEVHDSAGNLNDCRVVFDRAPVHELVDQVIAAVGGRAREAMKVEVAFSELLEQGKLDESSWWSRSSKDAIEIPLGPRGARDVQVLQLGAGLSHHGVIVGRPGSGKTNLMHVMITALALSYSPAELELYLIDFKKGVGFKAYADYALPHARVIAIESEREFGISVLRGLDRELTRRGELFRAAGGAEKLSEYRERTGDEMARVVLIADEYQEFFTAEDAIAREAALLFDRLVRQGRAFGMHVILGTQTLSGSYGLARSTVDQMAIRIALQCSDADSRLILGDDNPAARLLSRPGEAIYNDGAGTVEANKQFQVALFTEEDKKTYLARIKSRASGSGGWRRPIVFEGHLPAELDQSEDYEKLMSTCAENKCNPQRGVDGWLGEPIAIKEPTAARFRRQAGANLLVVSREEEQGLGVLGAAIVTLAAQHSDEQCRFIIADYTMADAAWSDMFRRLCVGLPHEAQLVKRREVPDALRQLLAEIEKRIQSEATATTNTFVVVAGLQRARELRKDENDFSNESPADDLLKVLREGPDVGIHTIVLADTYASLPRSLGRKALSEFGLRAVGVMSAQDSQDLIDDAAASRIDRPHRMVFFDEEKPGVLEKFRPFAMPPGEWLDGVCARLADTGKGESGD